MTFISVTRLRVRSWRFMPGFMWFAVLTLRQAKSAAGNLRAMTLQDAHLTFWTLTAWESDAAMRSYMLSGAHRRAMPKLQHWCDEASVVHWTQDTPDLPNWLEAHRRMQGEGRSSKVHNPSADHQGKRIASPRC